MLGIIVRIVDVEILGFEHNVGQSLIEFLIWNLCVRPIKNAGQFSGDTGSIVLSEIADQRLPRHFEVTDLLNDKFVSFSLIVLCFR